MESVDDFLAHHGILGMKWGIRRRTGSSGGSSGKNVLSPRPGWANPHPKHSPLAKTPAALVGHKVFGRKVIVTKVHSEDSAQVKAIATKARTHGHHSLSNEELKKLTARFNLEQQYAKMAAEQAKKKNPAAKFIKKQLGSMGDRAISSFANHVVDERILPLMKTKLLK
jgi:hypothetical protein